LSLPILHPGVGFCDFLFIFAVAFERMFELWCNGNTADFGSVVLGSNPGSSTRKGGHATAFFVHTFV
jgi:hypothetical protein